ncbi:MAG: hypothetical protein ACR2I2_03215 [Bryobacteraceae bacterium]
MQLSDCFLRLGEDGFKEVLRGVAMGKLKLFRLYDRLKTRTHLAKLNTENLRNAAPRLWARLGERDEEFATDLSQCVLVSQLDMIIPVLDFLGIPNDDGFFEKNLDPKTYLTDGWQQRVFEHFRETFPEPLLLFYINHLGLELAAVDRPFRPAA